MPCCTTYIGEFPHNSKIPTGIKPANNGTYVIELLYLGVIHKKEVVISAAPGQEIFIDRPFNENYLYKFNIYNKSNGTPEKIGNCFEGSFKTYVEINDNCPKPNCE